MSQYIVVDDTDPRIQYEGSDWTLTTAGATEDWGVYGPTYNHTLHETRKDASVSLRFNGTTIGFYGTIDTIDNQPRPSWACTIDGKGTGRVDAKVDQRINHWVLCEQPVQGFQEHLITLNVTVPEGVIFRLDQALYKPSHIITEGEVLMIHENDPMVTYQQKSNWNDTGISYDTDTPGSALTFNFTGTSAEFYSILKPRLKASTAEYKIDGGPPQVFTIPSQSTAYLLYNQALFSATGLSPTEHSLVVTFTGERGDTPLVFDYFFITLPSLKEVPTSSGSNPPPLSLGSGSNGAKLSNPAGAIVGGVVGGIAGLTLIGLAILFFMRRRHHEPSPELLVTPFPNEQEPKLVASTLSTPTDAQPTFNPYTPSGAANSGSPAIRKPDLAIATFNNEPRGVRHMDSGVRLGRLSGNSALQDIPPDYTEH